MPLRFDENPQRTPRNYLLRREQSRLLMLVVALGVVVLAMQQVRSPEVVAVFDQVFGDPAAADANAAAPRFDEDSTSGPAVLDAEQFAKVRDNSMFRNAETDAWFYAWSQLQRAAPPTAAPMATYAQLASQPNEYRGRAVTIAGAVHRIETVTPADNDHGIEQLYRLTVQPRGGEVWPITLYCLDAPTTLEIKRGNEPALRATGYFFKNQSYRWSDGLGLTPVVLARSASIQQPPTPPAETKPATPELSHIAITAGLISLLLVALFLMRSDWTTARTAPDEHKPIEINIPVAASEQNEAGA